MLTDLTDLTGWSALVLSGVVLWLLPVNVRGA